MNNYYKMHVTVGSKTRKLCEFRRYSKNKT